MTEYPAASSYLSHCVNYVTVAAEGDKTFWVTATGGPQYISHDDVIMQPWMTTSATDQHVTWRHQGVRVASAVTNHVRLFYSLLKRKLSSRIVCFFTAWCICSMRGICCGVVSVCPHWIVAYRDSSLYG